MTHRRRGETGFHGHLTRYAEFCRRPLASVAEKNLFVCRPFWVEEEIGFSRVWIVQGPVSRSSLTAISFPDCAEGVVCSYPLLSSQFNVDPDASGAINFIYQDPFY